MHGYSYTPGPRTGTHDTLSTILFYVHKHLSCTCGSYSSNKHTVSIYPTPRIFFSILPFPSLNLPSPDPEVHQCLLYRSYCVRQHAPKTTFIYRISIAPTLPSPSIHPSMHSPAHSHSLFASCRMPFFTSRRCPFNILHVHRLTSPPPNHSIPW